MHPLANTALCAALGALIPVCVKAGITISIATSPPPASEAPIRQPLQDLGGTTSLRFLPPRDGPPDKNDPAEFLRDSSTNKPRVYYYTRDRDLGQTFTVGKHPIRWESLTLRIGPTDSSVQEGAPGAEIFLQVFAVLGTPHMQDQGTTGADSSKDGKRTRWKTYDPSDPKTDDIITGETFVPLQVMRGTLPTQLSKDDWLHLHLKANDHMILNANSTYAWVIGFTSPASRRALALANCCHPNDPQKDYAGGHGLRRDGSTTDLETTFARALSDEADLAASRRAAAFPPLLADRLAIPPGTIGFPDVEGHRDFVFFIGGREIHRSGNTSEGSRH